MNKFTNCTLNGVQPELPHTMYIFKSYGVNRRLCEVRRACVDLKMSSENKKRNISNGFRNT